MFWNNVKIALRNLRKNKVFALVNILGLALGLTIYVFGGLLVKYESTHDMFFRNAANIYTIGSIAAPDLDVGVDNFNATFSAVGPLIDAELQDVELVARTVSSEYLLSVGDKSFYEGLHFADRHVSRDLRLQLHPWRLHRTAGSVWPVAKRSRRQSSISVIRMFWAKR